MLMISLHRDTQSMSSNWVRLFLSERFSDFMVFRRQSFDDKTSSGGSKSKRHEAALKIQRCTA